MPDAVTLRTTPDFEAWPAFLPGEPQFRLWTKEEYYRLADQGFFSGQRAELIEGVIMVQSPQNAEHFSSTDRVVEVLRMVFGDAYHARMQGPIDLGLHSEPEPDVAVVLGKRDDFSRAHPKAAVLVVEVSDSTLRSDRARKGSLYARAGLTEYWIVNLVDGQVEVYRSPQPDASQLYGFRYADRQDFKPPAVISPLAFPAFFIGVQQLLPPA
jgi:Uma2 family endonuclease